MPLIVRGGGGGGIDCVDCVTRCNDALSVDERVIANKQTIASLEGLKKLSCWCSHAADNAPAAAQRYFITSQTVKISRLIQGLLASSPWRRKVSAQSTHVCLMTLLDCICCTS